MQVNHFCSHLRQEGQINLISSPDCYICIGVSENTHNGHLCRHKGHMAIWPFDAIMAIWPYIHMAFMETETAIKMWQSIEGIKSI